MVQEFSDFAEEAQVSNEEVGLNGGVVWHSARLGGPTGQYDAPLPPGLHIGCGIAKMWSYSKDCGEFETDGVCMTILHVPEGGTCFQTKIQSGAVRSIGLYLPTAAMDTDDSILATIREAALGNPILCLKNGSAMRSAPRLTSLVSPAYQGAVRDTLLQARALELTAIIAAEFGKNKAAANSFKEKRCVFDVRDYIESHLSTPCSLESLARANNVSVRTMTSAFKRAFGETIAEYIRRRRMEEAAAAIEHGATVAEAAFMVGYTPNAFSTMYKKQFHRNPSA